VQSKAIERTPYKHVHPRKTTEAPAANRITNNHTRQFIPARDSRNRRVPGLYIRNGRFYCQLWVDRGDGRKTARRFPLFTSENLPARTLNEAKEALEIKRNDRREDRLPTPGRKPNFLDYSEVYLAKAKVQRKRPGTVENERQAIARWRSHLGHVRIDKIATPMIASFVEKRLKGGLFGTRKLAPVLERTANLDVIALRNVLNAAIDDGYLRDLPRIKLLKETPAKKRQLLTPAEFERLITSAITHCKTNGPQLADYLCFLAFSGVREQEALRIKWADVDFERERIGIGSDGMSKNRESRSVEFNPKLRTHLIQMKANRAPDCSWLFPSPRRGTRDERTKSFRESLKLARKAAGLDWIGFHDLRHYFCSICVMAGIDFMTIAAWMGHSDGGVLVGKVYGHLLNEHRQEMAAKLTIGLASIQDAPQLRAVD
jgi:integrase